MLGEIQFLAVLLDIILESVGIFVTGEFPNAFGHLLEVARGVYVSSCSLLHEVLVFEGLHSEFFVSVSSDGLEDFFDHFWVVEEGRSTVEGVSVFFEQSCASTNSVCLFEDSDVHA